MSISIDGLGEGKPWRKQAFEDMMQGVNVTQEFADSMKVVYTGVKNLPFEQQMQVLAQRHKESGGALAEKTGKINETQALMYVLNRAHAYETPEKEVMSGTSPAVVRKIADGAYKYYVAIEPTREVADATARAQQAIARENEQRRLAERTISAEHLAMFARAAAGDTSQPTTPTVPEEVTAAARARKTVPTKPTTEESAPAARDVAATEVPAPADGSTQPPQGGRAPAARSPAPASTRSGFTGTEYTIQNGDSLAHIARRTPELMALAKEAFPTGSGRDLAYALALAIAKKNNIDVADSVAIGTKLTRPTDEEIKAELTALKGGAFKESVRYVAKAKTADMFASAVAAGAQAEATAAAAITPELKAAIGQAMSNLGEKGKPGYLLDNEIKGDELTKVKTDLEAVQLKLPATGPISDTLRQAVTGVLARIGEGGVTDADATVGQLITDIRTKVTAPAK